jgi:ATP-binding cassette subfamily B protein
MATQNWQLTLYVLAPLPLLAITIYFVNTVINKKSEKIQGLLSDLTTTAQESYSGIRVIKSFVQEKPCLDFSTIIANCIKKCNWFSKSRSHLFSFNGFNDWY